MHRFISKRHIVFYLSFLLLLTTSCNQKPEEWIKTYEKARNRGKVKKVLSYCAEDMVFEIVGQWAIEGKGEFKKLVETDVALHSHLVFTDVKVDTDKVTCKVMEQNDMLKLAGIDTLTYESREFIFEKGLLKAVKSRYTEESTKAMREFQISFGRWTRKNRSEELDELRKESVITKDNVGKWLELMRAWREALKQEEQEESEKDVNKPDL